MYLVETGGGGGLSDGAVAGIVVGSVIGGLLMVALIVAAGTAVAMKVRQGESTSNRSRVPTSQ